MEAVFPVSAGPAWSARRSNGAWSASISRLGERLRRRFFRGTGRPRPELFRPDVERDTFLVSYPRSGNTWIRNIISCILHGRSPESLLDLGGLVPDIHRLPRKDEVRPLERFVIKSHEPWEEGSFPFGRYQRVIYVVRHPLDVLRSYYRFMHFTAGYTGDIQKFCGDWLDGTIDYGRWDRHVQGWSAAAASGEVTDFYLLRYEDLLADPASNIVTIAAALGQTLDERAARRIAADSSAEHMRERERKGVRRGLRVEGYQFIGEARAEQWRGELEPELVEQARLALGDTAEKFGYAF